MEKFDADFLKEYNKLNADVIIDDIYVMEDERVLNIELWYPDVPGNIKEFEIGLSDVRASDGIRVSYCKKRDGWVIKQREDFEDKEIWHEVGFFQSWKFEKERDDV